VDLEGLRRRLLEARDARAALLASLRRPGPALFLSLNVPGADKNAPRLDRVFDLGRAALRRALPEAAILAEGRDALGPYVAFALGGSAPDAKLSCVRLEEALPFGRLLDLDVFAGDGRQVDRRSLGLAQRRCLVCDETAVDCIRAARHSAHDLSSAVLRLARSPLTALARALVDGACAELDLTPKPGLVDRRDNGSHPDLSYDSMRRSIDTLPAYYDELIELSDAERLDLPACVAAGVRAEERMQAAAGSNTHRGYIFLSGLLLLAAAAEVTGTTAGWRTAVRQLAHQVTAGGSRPAVVREVAASSSHGGDARRRYRVAGVLGEALAGVPSVFDHGLPALERGLVTLGSEEAARHLTMAVLMTKVEDTTALHRCGPDGLARLKEDGARLAALIERGGDYLPWLRTLNEEYRAARLTMGGTADCLALTLAVHANGSASDDGADRLSRRAG
jgi:triphosphoribosyl-dephospho-CoA synthase